MRRLLAILLLMPPAAAFSQTTGAIVFSPDAAISKAECDAAATTQLGLTWIVTLDTGVVFSSNGEFRIYASDTQPTGNYCAVGTTGVGQIGTVSSPTSVIQSTPVMVSLSDMLTATGFDCVSGDKTIYVCVHWWSSSLSADKGYARGTVKLSMAAPVAPTVTRVQAGNGALYVTLAAGTATSSSAAAATFAAKAVAADGIVHLGSTSSSTDVRIGGLVNGTPYTVTGYAYSAEGNQSPESAAWGTQVAPQPDSNAWEVYGQDGGRDSGGCQSGGAGLLALLG
ncbi:MAG: hypothetical protein WCC48_02560, partial [Anaeromyxobacteraceae bacterium]